MIRLFREKGDYLSEGHLGGGGGATRLACLVTSRVLTHGESFENKPFSCLRKAM
jgi:hypothetical protein